MNDATPIIRRMLFLLYINDNRFVDDDYRFDIFDDFSIRISFCSDFFLLSVYAIFVRLAHINIIIRRRPRTYSGVGGQNRFFTYITDARRHCCII